MTGRLNSATAIGSFLIVFGLLAGWYGIRIEPDMDGGLGARVFPLLASSAIALMGVLELRRGLTGDPTPLALSNNPGAIIGLLALCIAYLFLMTKLGYLLSTGFAAPLAMWLFGMRSPLWLLLTALICPAIYHLIFFELLGVFPPLGEWFDLLDLLQGY